VLSIILSCASNIYERESKLLLHCEQQLLSVIVVTRIINFHDL
jgi:hypothetical protein